MSFAVVVSSIPDLLFGILVGWLMAGLLAVAIRVIPDWRHQWRCGKRRLAIAILCGPYALFCLLVTEPLEPLDF